MIELRPKKIKAVEIYILSVVSEEGSEEQKVQRKVPLGVFRRDVETEDIHEVLTSDVAPQILSAHSLSSGEVQILRSPVEKTEGMIFESIDECLKLLRKGVGWDDIQAGCELTRTLDAQEIDIMEL